MTFFTHHTMKILDIKKYRMNKNDRKPGNGMIIKAIKNGT